MKNMFSQKEVEKFPVKMITAEKFIKLAEVDQEFVKENIRNLNHNDFLAIWRKKKDMKWYRLHLKKIFFKSYNLSYRTTKTKNGKERIGKELMISSMPLPRGSIII